MKIGILSDTHGNVAVAADAARRLRSAGAETVFHCGDIGGMDVLAELAGVFDPEGITVHAVLGNVDFCASDWKFFPSNVGVQLHGRFGDITLSGSRFALLHGDDSRLLRQVIRSGTCDYVLTGHTHEPHDFMTGRVRCINPGTAGRGSPDTCAVLDMGSGILSILEL